MGILKSVFIILFVAFIQGMLLSQEDINFSDKAVRIKTIKLPKKVLIGDISSLDVDKGKILVTDRIGNAVYLFNEKGEILKILSAEECNPGFNWRPFDAKFNKAGKIILLNSIPWGFRFDENGKCIGGMDDSFIAPPRLAFLKDGSMIGYHNLIPNQNHHLKVMDKYGIEKFKFGKFPKEFEKLIYRFEGGGIVTDNNDNIYQLNVCSPEIFKYDKKGKFIKSFVNTPSYFRRIEKDYSSNNPEQSLKELPGLIFNKTIAIDLFMLEPGKLMVQLYHNKFYGILLYNFEGKNLLKEEIIIDKKILCAKNGLIYIMQQPEPDDKGNLPNPYIEIYKLKENTLNK